MLLKGLLIHLLDFVVGSDLAQKRPLICQKYIFPEVVIFEFLVDRMVDFKFFRDLFKMLQPTFQFSPTDEQLNKRNV